MAGHTVKPFIIKLIIQCPNLRSDRAARGGLPDQPEPRLRPDHLRLAALRFRWRREQLLLQLGRPQKAQRGLRKVQQQLRRLHLAGAGAARHRPHVGPGQEEQSQNQSQVR